VLGATERGLGGCIIGSVKRPRLRSELEIPECYEILLVLALSKPAETVVIEDLPADGNIDCYRDEASVHHVSKRSLDERIIGQYGWSSALRGHMLKSDDRSGFHISVQRLDR